jgi:hypothetical protein
LFVTSSAKAHFHEKIGFPAFSLEKQLVGFFREVEPADGTSGAASDERQLEFLSLGAARAAGQLNDENVAAGAHSLDRELTRQSKSVFTLATFNGTLDDMKAAALFYFTEKSMISGGGGAERSEGVDSGDLELFRSTSDTDPIWTFEL